MVPNGFKWVQMVPNGSKSFKFSKWLQMVHNEHHDTHLRPCFPSNRITYVPVSPYCGWPSCKLHIFVELAELVTFATEEYIIGFYSSKYIDLQIVSTQLLVIVVFSGLLAICAFNILVIYGIELSYYFAVSRIGNRQWEKYVHICFDLLYYGLHK